MALESLRITDYSDREVLLIVKDLADPDGWVLAEDVGGAIGIVQDHRRRAAAQRLSWLQRYGAVEREHLRDAETGELAYRTHHGEPYPKWGQRWRLTDMGEQMADGKLRAPQQRALDGLTDAQLLLAMRHVSSRARVADGAKLIEREWRYQWAQR